MEPAQQGSGETPVAEPTIVSPNKGRLLLFVVGALAIVSAGTATGYLLADSSGEQASSPEATVEQPKERPKSAEEDKAFSVCAEGKLEALKESDLATYDGTYRLVTGEVGKDAYLTSSVVELSKYEGDRVTVWGESHASRKVGWLMDVGRISQKTGTCPRQ